MSSPAAVVTLLLLASAAPLLAQDRASAAPAAPRPDARRALMLEDYYRLRTVASPRMAPDGAWVVYTVTTPVEETNRSAAETWLVSSAGGAPVRVRHDGEDVSGAGWHDDGRLRYTIGGATWLVHPARLDGARERFAPASREGITSPDGGWLARLQDVPAPARPAPRRSAFEQRHAERFAGHEFDWFPFLRDGQSFPLPDAAATAAAELFVEPLSGGEARQLTRLGLRPTGLQWAPDGSALLFSANAAWRDELRYGASDLFLVRLDGAVTRLTDDGHTYSGARFSPDSRRIAYVRGFGTDMIVEQALDHGGPTDLYVRPVAGGEPVNLTADWDLDAGAPTWSPDGRYLYFTADVGGATHLFRVPSAGGEVAQVTRGERRIQGVDFDRALRRMTYTVGDLDRPSDVYVADIDGANERRLSDVHADFHAEVAIATHPAEAVRWRSHDGTEIEGFLLFPYGYDPDAGPYPLIVMNHGGPHAASGYRFSFKDRLFTANGYFVFLPNFRSSTGYGDAFKWGTWGAWGDRDGEDVVSGVDHLIAHYPIDGGRVGTTGHSYGGIITNWLITRYPDRFRAAVSGAGESNWTSNFALSDIARTKETEFFGRPWDARAQAIMIRQSPYLNCGGVRAATLFVHGEVDYRVPLSGALQLYTCLKKQGVPAKMLIYEGQAHSISGHWNNVHRMMSELEWWRAHLGAPALDADAAGHWEGLLRIPGEPVAVAVLLERAGGEWRATLDIPARRVERRPVDNVAVRGDTVLLELPRQFRLRGVLGAGGQRLDGEVEIQGGLARFALAPAGSAHARALADELAAYQPPQPAADPLAARIVTDDIERFWRAWDASTPANRAEVLQREYIDRATPGLEDFMFRRVHSAEALAETVDRFPNFYASTRASMRRVAEFEPEIRRAFQRLEALHPEAVYPDVYFTVGRLTTGGTVSPRGLLIGTELYARTPATPESEFEPWMLELFSPIETVPALVAHELIHYQQRVGGAQTLLRQALVEGVADYLGAMISGGHINERRHRYGDAHEAELWCEFREQMRGDDLSRWFYNMRTAGDRPSDLGYWMGYRIAQAWAERVADERERVRGLLVIDDPEAFLAASGYAARFACADRSGDT